MAKGLIGGMTDYSHQTLQDIIGDIENEHKNVTKFIELIEQNVQSVTTSGYWRTNVHSDFRNIVIHSLKHYHTAQTELSEIAQELKIEVREHHIRRLERIGTVADDINIRIGTIWNQKYERKEYGNSDFEIVEDIYADTRDMAVNLLDMVNIAVRLKDYIGKSNLKIMKNNPWISGSFYVFVSIVAIAGLAVLSNNVSWVALPIIIIGGILLIGIIGALQLKNDDKLKDDSFVKLIIETYKRLPLLKNTTPKNK
jgi:hypothetical protein